MFFLTANNDKDAVKKLNRPGTDRENVFVKPDERLVENACNSIPRKHTTQLKKKRAKGLNRHSTREGESGQ